MFRHDLSHTGRSQYDTSKNNGQKRWEFAAGGRGSSPAIDSNGIIYIGSGSKLYALYPDGTKKWSYETGYFIDSSPAIGSDGIIYFGNEEGYLYALYPNGTEKWGFFTWGYVRSSPAIGPDGIIYVCNDAGKIYAIYPDAKKKWDFTILSSVWSSPAIGPDGTIYIGSYDGKLYALNPNGTKKWDFITGDIVFSSPAIGTDGTIYVGSDDNKLYGIFPNGTKKWEFITNHSVESSPAIGSDGTIYIGSNDGRLYALFPNGTKKWDFITGSFVRSSPAIGSDGTIYVGSDDHNLYALYPNGTRKWNLTTGGSVYTSPAIGSDGTIYFGSDDYKLYAIGTTPPTAPQDLRAMGGNAQVDLTWKAPRFSGGSAITNYSIYRGTTSGCETFLVKIGNVTSYLDTSVTNGLIYFYEVTASNALAESPRSNEANATPLYNGPASSPWPMFHHDLNHTGRSQYDTSKNNGKENWSYTTGGFITSSPVIGSDGTIYFGSQDNKFYALYPNGTQKWAFESGSRIVTSPAISSDGTIYFSSDDNKFYALFPNGTKKWDFTVEAAIDSSPMIGMDGTIYFGCEDTKLHALFPNGTEKWNFTTGSNIGTSTPAIGPDGTIYVGSLDGKLYAVFSNGTKKWDFDTGNMVQTSPAIGPDGTIYFGSDFGSADTKFYALNPDGTKKWAISTGKFIYSSPAIGSDGTIYFGSENHKLYAIYPNGTKKWDFTTGNAVTSSPAIGLDGTIYVGSADAKLYALYPNGTKKWDFTTGDEVGSSPAIGSDGTIYFGSVDGKLYALGTPPVPTTPAAPLALQAIGGNSQVSLTWTTPISDGGSPITNYTIYRGTTSGCETFLIKIGNVTSYLDKGLTNGQVYFYEVTANNIIGEGLRSNEANATPMTTPTAPQDLTTVLGNAQIILNWKAPLDDGGTPITGYNIYRGTTAGGGILFVMGYTGGTSWNDTQFTGGTTYFYVISAVNVVGEGPKSDERNITVGDSPHVPSGLTATGGNAQIVLRWSAPTGGGTPTHYNVYRSDSQNGNYTLIASPTTTKYKDTGLTNGHKYWYKINAQNPYGVSGNTTAVSAKPYATSTNLAGLFLLGIIIVIITVLVIVETMRIYKKKKA
jgi:outer membrane protein assembly factor BamB